MFHWGRTCILYIPGALHEPPGGHPTPARTPRSPIRIRIPRSPHLGWWVFAKRIEYLYICLCVRICICVYVHAHTIVFEHIHIYMCISKSISLNRQSNQTGKPAHPPPTTCLPGWLVHRGGELLTGFQLCFTWVLLRPNSRKLPHTRAHTVAQHNTVTDRRQTRSQSWTTCQHDHRANTFKHLAHRF